MNPAQLLQAARQATEHLSDQQLDACFGRMNIMLSAPRSGSTLLFEQLCQQPDVWSIGYETHVIFNLFPHLRFENAQQDSGALTAAHADAQTSRMIKAVMLFMLHNNQGQRFLDPASNAPATPVIIEKTPRNAINLPFLKALFPQARFVYIHRQPQATIASLMEAWQVGLQSGRFVTYRNLPGWHLPAWCFLLPRGWRDLIGCQLAEVCCFQWVASNRSIQQQLSTGQGSESVTVSYEALLADPQATLSSMMAFIDPDANQPLIPPAMGLSRSTLTAPDEDKWLRHEAAIMALQDQWRDVLKGC